MRAFTFNARLTVLGSLIVMLLLIGISTPHSTAAQPSCSRHSQGDANCDGNVDGIDFSIWLNTQCHRTSPSQVCADLRADFNNDGNVDDADYQIWVANEGMPGNQPPAIPGNLQASAIDATNIRLIWQDNSNNETGFDVYEGSLRVATKEANSISVTIGNLRPSSTHCYRIRAYNSSGTSAWSNEACVTIPIQAPTPYKSQWDANAGVGWNNCGPASVAMAMAYYGKDISVGDAAIKIRNNPNPHANTTTDFKKGTPTGNNTNTLLDQNGLKLVNVSSFDSLKAQLDLRRPVLILVKNDYYVRYDNQQQRFVPYLWRQDFSQHSDGTSVDHIVVVTGYDSVNVYINDPLAVRYDSRRRVIEDSQNGTNFAVPIATFQTAASAEGWHSAAVARK
jgi:uncharacterized protein YvpB